MSKGRTDSRRILRKEGKLSIPNVTWISVPDNSSARMSLRNVADYLSEKETESSMRSAPRRSRNLCISAESLEALENAEKLVEEAERQLSQLNLEAVLAAGDLDGIGFVGESDAYIRKIVASSFEKGKYEPITSAPTRSSKALSSGISSSGSRTGPESSTERMADDDDDEEEEDAEDDGCLLCSGKGCPSMVEAVSSRDNPCTNNNNKLGVQRGPTISIKPDLCVQTSRIIDIQPARKTSPRATSRTFEFHHESSSNSSSKSDGPGDEKEDSHSIMEPPSVLSSPDADLSLGEPRIILELDCLLSQQRSIIRKVRRSSQALDRLFLQRVASTSSCCDLDESFDSGRFDSAALGEQQNLGCFDDQLTSSCLLQTPKPCSGSVNVTARASDTKAVRIPEQDKTVIVIPEKPDVQLLIVDSRDTCHEDQSGTKPNSTAPSREMPEKELTCNETAEENVNSLACTASSSGRPSPLIARTASLSDRPSPSSRSSTLHQAPALQIQLDDSETPNIDRLNNTLTAEANSAGVSPAAQMNSAGKQSSDPDRARTPVEKHDSIPNSSNSMGDGSSSNNRNDDNRLRNETSGSQAELQRFNLLKNLESCSIQRKLLPFTSTLILNDTARPTDSAVETFAHCQSEQSSVTTHSEGEVYLSSSTSYSLGEIRRNNVVDYSSRSQGSSAKHSSHSDISSQNKTQSIQCSIGEFVVSIKQC